MSIKFGTFVPQGWRMDLVEIDDPIEQYETMTNVGKIAEEVGYDSIWVFDHFHTVPTPEIETCFEAWTITAGLARDTSRIRIGQMVTCNGYRNPALLAKIASTVDVMSHGRLICGLGAGWYEHEWRAYGYGFPDIPDRMRMFREATEIVVKMWTDEKASFKGKFYTIDGAINEPKGVQKPHITLWLGGGGEQVTLKLVAQWANGCNVGGGRPDVVKQKLDVLKGHCDKLGRNYDEITRSTGITVFFVEPGDDPEQATAAVRGSTPYEQYARDNYVGTPEQVIERIKELETLGIDYVITTFPRIAYDQTMLRRFASEVMPAFA
ncbi:MAG TPA: LLM class F420-dependent oxidoreductase [Phototrophicaceae bacterium]|nr:LLM class F420-dependent oxidoreductase [Phototrophicaceae bacterium]